MLEHRGVLLTWQLPRQPGSTSDLPLTAIRIGDHRLAYLEYEGPVSGDRGFVERVDSGALQVRQLTDGAVCFQLAGGRLGGAFELVRAKGDEWHFQNRETHRTQPRS